MSGFCIAAMTGDQANHWPTQSLSVGPFVLGRGAATLLTGIPYRTLEDGTVVFERANAYRVLAKFPYIALQHWPGENIIEQLHSFERRVGLWVNALSVQVSSLWNTVQHPMQAALKTCAMVGTDGEPVVTWPDAIAVDPRHRDFADALCGSLRYILDTAYTSSKPDFLFLDELTDSWYCTAPNKPAIDPAEWQAAVSRAVDALQGILPVWGHNTGTAYHIRTSVHEHATRGCASKASFIDHVGTLANMRAHASVPTALTVLGWERADDIPADWCTAVRDGVFASRVILQKARTGKAFQIFDPYAEA